MRVREKTIGFLGLSSVRVVYILYLSVSKRQTEFKCRSICICQLIYFKARKLLGNGKG